MTNRQMKISLSLMLGGALLAQVGTASAEDILDKYGFAVSLGGGVADFTQEDMRDTSGTAGIWGVRAAFGTRYPVAIEAAYMGSAQSIDAIGLDTSAVLLGSALEADARLNILPDEDFTPYAFVGAAWRRYDLTNADTNTSSVEDEDNLLEVPMGLGVAYRYSGLMADARAEFRAATNEDLLPETDGDGAVAMHTWGVSARIGYEF